MLKFIDFLLQKVCFVSINPQKEDSIDPEKSAYVLPDGNILEVCYLVIIGTIAFSSSLAAFQTELSRFHCLFLGDKVNRRFQFIVYFFIFYIYI